MKRFPATATFPEMFARLTNRQKDRVTVVRRAHEETTRLAVSQQTSQAGLNRAVLDALEAGVPSRVVAETLGVSSSRVYQIRNQAVREMDEVRR